MLKSNSLIIQGGTLTVKIISKCEENRLREIICKNCGRVLTYSVKDVYTISQNVPKGEVGSSELHYIKCICCGNKIYGAIPSIYPFRRK